MELNWRRKWISRQSTSCDVHCPTAEAKNSASKRCPTAKHTRTRSLVSSTNVKSSFFLNIISNYLFDLNVAMSSVSECPHCSKSWLGDCRLKICFPHSEALRRRKVDLAGFSFYGLYFTVCKRWMNRAFACFLRLAFLLRLLQVWTVDMKMEKNVQRTEVRGVMLVSKLSCHPQNVPVFVPQDPNNLPPDRI